MVYCADFETTSETNLIKDGEVRVWLWSLVECGTGNEWYGTDIESFFETICVQECDYVYFHNLKFDGKFIVNYLVRNEFIYGVDYAILVDDMNNWYEIAINVTEETRITLWDSLKKFPGCGVNDIAKMYGIPEKLEKPYFELYRPIDYKPTAEEVEYCLQDSRIIAYAINEQYKLNNKRMTLSSDAFADVKKTIGYRQYPKLFPPITLEQDNKIRLAYKGGFTYLNPKYRDKDLQNVHVYDVNSLYPWAMSYCPLPVKEPRYRKPRSTELYIVEFTTEFELNDGYIPTIQIKNSLEYKETEYLTESMGPVRLSLTNLDYELFKKHYYVYYEDEPEYISFHAQTGLLKPYIDKWTEVKTKAKKDGDWAMYYLAKRWLNSPYGKTATRMEHVNKIPYLTPEGEVGYIKETSVGKPVYLPYGTFVTAWARHKTITTAQKCYDQFIYADTDSLHTVGEITTDIDIDDYKLGAWKHESEWESGKYIRAKTYIHGDKDHNIGEVKCAGMPDNVKQQVTWDNFKIGQIYEGKLMQTSVKGGCVLAPVPFMIKNGDVI